MRHRVYGKHLGRNKDERDNLFKGLVQALLTHGTIQTSQTKAKAIKGLVDKVINSAKNKNSDRLFQSVVVDKYLRERLIREILPKLNTRTSGYTSIVKVGPRLGDQTILVKMSLIGAEELKPINKEPKIEKEKLSKKVENPQAKKAAPKPSAKPKRSASKKMSKKS